MKCIINGCCNKAIIKKDKLCRKHYMRIWRNGTSKISARERGDGTITKHGYISICINGKKKQEHVLIAEKVIGKELPAMAEVHHINNIGTDNRNNNLIICPSRAYHKLLHVRETALNECGNANYRKCPFCKEYSDPHVMKHNASSRYYYHSSCKSEYNKIRRVL